MKESSGELNMTLITIVAVALIGALFAALYPQIKQRISDSWGSGADSVEGSGK